MSHIALHDRSVLFRKRDVIFEPSQTCKAILSSSAKCRAGPGRLKMLRGLLMSFQVRLFIAHDIIYIICMVINLKMWPAMEAHEQSERHGSQHEGKKMRAKHVISPAHRMLNAASYLRHMRAFLDSLLDNLLTITISTRHAIRAMTR
jgi:hypothetical protein